MTAPDEHFGIDDIRRGDLLIRKVRTGPEEEIDDLGMIFSAHPIEIDLMQQGVTFRLNSLLPAGWRIVETGAVDDAACGLIGKCQEVRIPINAYVEESDDEHPFFSQPHSVVGTLHECGHANIQEALTPAERLEHAEVFSGQPMGKDSKTSDRDAKLWITHMYIHERNAWAYAFRKYRMLVQRGINGEPDIDFADIMREAKRSLATYKALLIEIGIQKAKELR